MVKPAEPDKIPITSNAQLESEFALLQTAFNLPETEHTWEIIDKALKRFHAVVRGGVCKSAFVLDFIKGLKNKVFVAGLVRSMATERTRLSGTTLDLLSSLTRLSTAFLALLPHYLPPLLRLLCRTNKLYISRTLAALQSIIKNTRLPHVVNYIVAEWQAEGGKSSSFRIGASELLLVILGSTSGADLVVDKDSVGEKWLDEVEWIIRIAATDREVKVRAVIKSVWDIYRIQWPERVSSFTAPLTPVTRKYLHITASGPAVAPRLGPSTLSLSSATLSTRAPIKRPEVPAALRAPLTTTSVQPVSVSSAFQPFDLKKNPLSKVLGPALPSVLAHAGPKSRAVSASASTSSLHAVQERQSHKEREESGLSKSTSSTSIRHHGQIPASASSHSLKSSSSTYFSPPPPVPVIRALHAERRPLPLPQMGGFKPSASAPLTGGLASRVLPPASRPTVAALSSSTGSSGTVGKKASRAVQPPTAPSNAPVNASVGPTTATKSMLGRSVGADTTSGLFRPKPAAAGRVVTAASNSNSSVNRAATAMSSNSRTSATASISALRPGGSSSTATRAPAANSTVRSSNSRRLGAGSMTREASEKARQLLALASATPLPLAAPTITAPAATSTLSAIDSSLADESADWDEGIGLLLNLDTSTILTDSTATLPASDSTASLQDLIFGTAGEVLGEMVTVADELRDLVFNLPPPDVTSTPLETEEIAMHDKELDVELVEEYLAPVPEQQSELLQNELAEHDEMVSPVAGVETIVEATETSIIIVDSTPTVVQTAPRPSPVAAAVATPLPVSPLQSNTPLFSFSPAPAFNHNQISPVFDRQHSPTTVKGNSIFDDLFSLEPESFHTCSIILDAGADVLGVVRLPGAKTAEKVVGVEDVQNEQEAQQAMLAEQVMVDEVDQGDLAQEEYVLTLPTSPSSGSPSLVDESMLELHAQSDDEGDATLHLALRVTTPVPLSPKFLSAAATPPSVSRINNDDDALMPAENDDDQSLLVNEHHFRFSDETMISAASSDEEAEEGAVDEFAQTVILQSFREHLPAAVSSPVSRGSSLLQYGLRMGNVSSARRGGARLRDERATSVESSETSSIDIDSFIAATQVVEVEEPEVAADEPLRRSLRSRAQHEESILPSPFTSKATLGPVKKSSRGREVLSELR